jgi:hypothetical protein
VSGKQTAIVPPRKKAGGSPDTSRHCWRQRKFQPKLPLTLFRLLFLGAFAKLRRATICFMSVRPLGTTQLPREEFSQNLVGFFRKYKKKIQFH